MLMGDAEESMVAMRTFPSTCRRSDGEVVPMPTFPLPRMDIFSVLSTSWNVLGFCVKKAILGFKNAGIDPVFMLRISLPYWVPTPLVVITIPALPFAVSTSLAKVAITGVDVPCKTLNLEADVVLPIDTFPLLAANTAPVVL
jgi:hypothetical protein